MSSSDEIPARSHTGVVALLAFAGLVVTILQTMIVPLIPELPTILGVSPANASWM